MARLTEETKQSFVKDLTTLIQISSVLKEYQPRKNNPFGDDIQAALDVMLSIGKRDGFLAFSVDNYAGVIEMGAGEEIGILGHLDVVPVQDGWTYGPFSATIENGKMYGRGVNDDNGRVLRDEVAQGLGHSAEKTNSLDFRYR